MKSALFADWLLAGQPRVCLEAVIRILLAVHHFPPRFTAGAEGEAYRTAAALQARGHLVQVVCVEHIDRGTADGLTWEDDEYDGIPVRRLSFNLAATPDPFVWEYDNKWIGAHLHELILQFKPDVFHLFGGYLITGRALRVARALGVPTLVSLMDFWFLCRRISMLRSDGQLSTLPVSAPACAQCLAEERRRYRLPGRLAPALMESYWRRQKTQIEKVERRMTFLVETLNQVDVLISRSRFVGAMHAQAGVNSARLAFVRQGRDFAQLGPRLPQNVPGKALRVGYLGQIAQHKGVHVLAEAARRLPDASLQVSLFGNTHQFPRYAERLRSLISSDARVVLAGVLQEQPKVDEALRQLDVLVVPSLWYENSPNVILEAFAYGVPVIASNLGGMAELVAHGVNGLLFEPGNAKDLAEQLQTLLDDPALLGRLRAGIEPVATVAQEIDQIQQLYHAACAARREPIRRLAYS